MNILIIDNYDSFTYNLAYIVRQITGISPIVKRNDKVTFAEIDNAEKLILSPGPGIPSEAGLLLPVLQQYASCKNILGVCLGHQAIGEVFGAKLTNMPGVFHGVSSSIHITHPDPLFNNVVSPFFAARYHSWSIDQKSIDDNALQVLATDDAGTIMAIRHKKYNVHGVQFHPESILTPQGKQIISNWINIIK